MKGHQPGSERATDTGRRPNLRPGDVVHARVLAIRPDGTVLVEVEGARLAATASVALQPNRTYELTVLAVEPRPVLTAQRARVRLSLAGADEGGLLGPPPRAWPTLPEPSGARLDAWHRAWRVLLSAAAAGMHEGSPAAAWAADHVARRRRDAPVVLPLPAPPELGRVRAFLLPDALGHRAGRIALLCVDGVAGPLRIDLALDADVVHVGITVARMEMVPALRAACAAFSVRLDGLGLRSGAVRLRCAAEDAIGVGDLVLPASDDRPEPRLNVRA